MQAYPEEETAPAWLHALGYRRYESEDWATWWDWHGYPGIGGLWFPDWSFDIMGVFFLAGVGFAGFWMLLRSEWARYAVCVPTAVVTVYLLGDCLMADSMADLFAYLGVHVVVTPCWLACWWYWPPRRWSARLFWCVLSIPMVFNPSTVISLLSSKDQLAEWLFLFSDALLWSGMFVVLFQSNRVFSPRLRELLGLCFLLMLTPILLDFNEMMLLVAYWIGTFLPWIWIAVNHLAQAKSSSQDTELRTASA